MKLSQLNELFLQASVIGDPNTEFKGVQLDSRRIQSADLFVCIVGHNIDGHQYAEHAKQQGAAALVVEKKLEIELPQLVVKDTNHALAVIADHFFDYPSNQLQLIGVTGTNGKTTITYLVDRILRDQGIATGLMGTIEMRIGDELHDVKNTTQDALELQRRFQQMLEKKVEYCVMEVSSHALDMGRVKGCDFRTAIFTNLTQDHLDYHETMDNYREAKGLLFSRLGNTFSADPAKRKFAVLNADDPASLYFQRITSAEVITYGIESEADVKATKLKITPQGTSFQLNTFAGSLQMSLRLVGKFSVYNALAACAACLAEGISLEQIKQSLEAVEGVNGRFQAVGEGAPFLTIVDYAHTPDSLENVLSTVKELAQAKIICVFGCGGDRDRTKRPMMGAIAAQYADFVFVTSDNPRTEDPQIILEDVEEGVRKAGLSAEQYVMEIDRRRAIERAVDMAEENDIILIAGKGHETYQEVNGVRHDFDDREIAREAIRRLQK